MAPIPAGPDFPETSAFVRDDARVIRIRPGRYPSLWQICQVLESEMERGFGGSNLVIAGGILGLTHTTEHFWWTHKENYQYEKQEAQKTWQPVAPHARVWRYCQLYLDGGSPNCHGLA